MQPSYLPTHTAGHSRQQLPMIALYLTDGCNSRCLTCDIWKKPRRNMSLALVEDIVAACQPLGVRLVLLTGGEAMQHPDWAEVASRFRRAGVRVMLLTNGLYLRSQAQLAAGHLDHVIVSLDGGTPETYHAIRGVDAFDLVLEGIRAVRGLGLPVTTRTTIQKANFREMPLIIEVGQAAGANTISFLPVDVGNPFAFGNRSWQELPLASADMPSSVDQMLLSADECDELARILERVSAKYAGAFASGQIVESPARLSWILLHYFQTFHTRGPYHAPPCNAPDFSIVIEVDGTLRPCYFLPHYARLQPGQTSLGDLLDTPEARELRQAYREGRRPECVRCVCPRHYSS